jgi:hypothetical protein
VYIWLPTSTHTDKVYLPEAERSAKFFLFRTKQLTF